MPRVILERLFNEGYICGVDGLDPMNRETDIDYGIKQLAEWVRSHRIEPPQYLNGDSMQDQYNYYKNSGYNQALEDIAKGMEVKE